MSIGGINPFFANAFQRTGGPLGPGVNAQAAPTPTTANSGNNPTGTPNGEEPKSLTDLMGTLQMMATSFMQSAGLASDPAAKGEKTIEQKKWATTLKSSSRVAANVTPVKVKPSDDSGYWAALGYN